jgi:hypothetical protein
MKRMNCCTVAVFATGALGGIASAQIRITEYMYAGANGEFVEFTNRGASPVDMTGWSFDDNSRVPGSFSVSAFGVVAPGESVILTDNASAAAFRTAWGLAPTVKVIPGNTQGLGRDDEINLYDNTDALVTRLTYGDQAFPGTIRTQNRSGWPCAEVLGQDTISGSWNLSALADAQVSYASSGGDIGSPGTYIHTPCGPPPSGACCTAGVCTDPVEEIDCNNGGGTYQGDGSDCTSVNCPAPSDGNVRITEYMYTGSGPEFVEFTNLDVVPVSMAGWSFDDDSQIPGTVSLAAFGTLAPGESAILTDAGTVADFEIRWGLSGIKVIAGNLAGLGRNDEINLYNASAVLKDRLTYGDQTFPGTIRTQGRAGWPCAEAVGANNIYLWQFATVGDSQGSYASVNGDIGSPGNFASVSCNALPTGACCDSVGFCTDVPATVCIQAGKIYQGDGSSCASFTCPAPSGGIIRITEYMYSGSGGEFVEFTNLDVNPIDMTGWSYDDDSNVPGTVDLSAFGVVAPGQSVILAEDTAAVFIADWNLAGVVVIGGNTTNLGRNDQINLYDGSGALVDRLSYGDQTFPGTIRTQNFSGWPCDTAIGANNIFDWFLSAVGDPQNSYTSANGDVGNPGTFVLQPCAFCGNGRVDAGEDCDGGACCTDQCTFVSASTECRPTIDVCDVAEFCTGADAACPPDLSAPQGTICRASTGPCDPAEECNGVSVQCPADALSPSSTECRPAAGVCDVADFCTGQSADCPADAKSTAVCRASAGDCDVAESCDGVSNDCPTDGFASSSTVCRGLAGPCDVAENCTGNSANCPADGFAPSSQECRASAGICDVAESCSGSSADCPADGFVAGGSVCRPAQGDCDVAEACSGNSADCPANGFSSGNVCRPSTGPCDPAETCSGSVADCPGDSQITACTGGDGCCPTGCTSANDSDCPSDAIPTVSEWGLAILTLLLLVAGKLYFGRREVMTQTIV